MIRLPLINSEFESESWWVNFSNSLPDIPTLSAPSYTSSLADWSVTRDKMLSDVHAKVVNDNFRHCLEFDSEEDATLFLLRWA